MADPVNHIIPSTVAPERYSVLRRDRDEKNRKEHHNRNSAPRAFPAASETENTSADKPDEPKEPGQENVKGKILDINA
jgi:hypothetical protein